MSDLCCNLVRGSLLGQTSGTLWFPPQSSTVAGTVDQLFWLIFYISAFFFVLIVGLMCWFVLHYRRRADVAPQRSPSHNTVLELAWSGIPALILGVIFVQGVSAYMNMRVPPSEAYEISVIGKKWSWSFQYPNGYVDNNLHIPVGRPVKLVMSSDDVIHSLFVPAFRIKMDVIPGRYSQTWFQATQEGEFRLYCAEYCGENHSLMIANVVVHSSGEFEKWLADASNFLDKLPPAEAGKLLYERRGCVQCHSLDGSAKAGPTFKGSFGTQQALASGEPTTVDENYIRESILEPQAKVRAGFRPVMPTYRGQLKDQEITAIIEFIKSLK